MYIEILIVAVIVFFILIWILYGDFAVAVHATGSFIATLGESIKMIFTGGVGVDDLSGPVGISGVVAQTTNIANYIYILAVISVSLGVTNLLPIPALDGGKILNIIIIY